ncbi:MAG: thymidylate synthase (FAD) [Crocinitomicaceae bacterium]|nr:thymidylate synthase (FAD) [Crocinitomicaceae bacterium]|tara:strand:- start:1172 stop:1831 length:660 start_codon:yes stop_codon:yes gene_type:complete
MFNVRVVSYSKSMIDENLDDDLINLVAYCARVSNPGNQNNNETAEKLIKYLIKNKHWSPLEMANVCMEIETTRDIARQILRHRSFSFQEFSQRYADPTEDLNFVTRPARLQDTKNRQNSIEIPMEDSINHIWESYQEVIIERCKHAYDWAIKAGIAKEQARAVLPEGLTMSRMYVNGTLRSWIHYIQLRSENGTQKEHIDIAKACAESIYQLFPLDDVI